MEKLLQKLASQLDSLDEASLMGLWSKYATQTSRFEPTKRWEEACLIFSLIQAKRFKNQLFNYHWGQERLPPLKKSGAPGDVITNFTLEKPLQNELKKGQCRVLSFSSEEPVPDFDNNEPDHT